MIPVAALALVRKPFFWYAVLAALLLGAAGIIKYQNARIETLDAKLLASQASTQVAVNANQANVAVLQELGRRLQACVERQRVDRDRRDEALKASELAREEALATAANERRKRDALWKSTQSCEGMRALHLDTACGVVADRLRERTAGRVASPNG